MFSAVDGFRMATINVADGYISTFNSAEIRTIMPDTSGSTLYLGTGNANDDLLWMKINNNTGARISQQKAIGNVTNTEIGYYATKDGSDNTYLIGKSYSSSTYTPAYIAKISNTGTITWQKEYYDGSQADINGIFTDVACENSGGNIYASGGTNKVVGGLYTQIPCIVKYDSSGVIQYQERSGYANTGSIVYNLSRINDLTVDDYGKLYITGLFLSYDLGNSQYATSSALQKRYANGTVEWDYALTSGTGNSYFNQSVVDSSNNVFYTGFYENDPGHFVGKLYSNGVQAWQIAYSDADITSMCLDSTGNLVTTGRLTPSLNTMFYINIDTSSGNINWQNFVNSSNSNIYISDINYANNFVYLGGYQQGYSGSFPGITMKLAANGNTAGTYGQFTFSTGNITSNTSTLTSTGTSLSFGTISYANATATLPINNGSITRKIIPL